MSVDFTQPPSSASIPDASETVKGKIRIATSAEATAGTDDLTAMTPLKVQSVVNNALVGGVTYQGTFDASSPADLSNATKGDLYIISVAGTYQGQTWAVGDHLLINADMGGTLDPSKIDKVDNTDAVTSVAGRTGAVTLSTVDISGLATVASTGAYSDLSGTPTNVSTFTNDAGYLTDITGEAIGDLSDVDVTGVSNNDVLVYNSTSGKWEAGTSPAPSIALNDLTDVTITGAATGEVLRYNGTAWVDAQLAYSDLSGTPTLATVATTGAYSDLSGTPTNVSTFTNDAGYLTDITGENLGDLSDVDVTGVSNGDVIAYNSTSGNWEATAQSGAPAASETVAGILEIATNAEATAGTATDKALVPSNISSITTAQLNNSAGTFLESANNLSDLANAATARTNLGLATVASTGAYSDLSGTPTLGTAAALDVGTSASNVVQLDGSAKLPAVDGSQLINLPAPSIALNDLTDVTITGAATGEVLRYNGTAWVDAQLAYSDLSGTPTLATVATTGAYSDLSGTPTNVSSFTNDAGYISNITGENLGDLADVDLTGLADGEIIIYNATSGNWEANPPPAPAATETSVGLIEIATNAEATTGTATDKALVPSNISSITTAQLDNSAGTMLEAANNLSDLTNAATARTNLGLATVASTGAYSDLSGTPTNVSSFTNDAGYISNITGENLGDLADVDLTGLSDGDVLIYNSTSGNWKANPPPAPVATETSVGLIEIATNAEATAGLATDKALVPSNISSITTAQLDNSAGTMLEAANNLSDLTNAATARTNLGLGSSATLDVGTSANNVVQLNGSAQLPAIDGSLLTGVVADISGASIGDLSDVDTTTDAPVTGELLGYDGTNWVPVVGGFPKVLTTTTTTTPVRSEEIYILTPTSALSFTLQSAATCGAGFKYQIKNMSTYTITISPSSGTIDGSASFDLATQYASVTLVTDGSNWFVI